MVKYFRKPFTLTGVSSHERLTDFYTSSWQRGDSPLPMLVVRLVVTVLALLILAWSIYEAPVAQWLLYLTNWGLLLVAAMAVSGLCVSICAVLRKIPEEGEPPWYVATYWVFFNVAVTIALVITLLYWILLFDSSSANTLDSVFWLETVTHGFNSVLVLVELFASRTPVRFAHIYQPLGVGVWYVVFSVVYYCAGGTDAEGNPWIYEILNWSNPGPTTALVAASVVGLLGVYSAVWGGALARDKFTGSLIRTISHTLPFTPHDFTVPAAQV